MTMLFSEYFTRRWVCEVVRSGYHNGAGCSPKDPHGDWNCCYRYEISMTEAQYEAFMERQES